MLIVGLGNPGAEYKNTRHNVGFMAVERIASRLNLIWKTSSKFKANIASGNVGGKKIILTQPDTFMNLSGTSISLIKSYYNIPIEDIIVIHDDLDIKTGLIKYKMGGGSAGHNGIKSLDQHIGNNYHRIRIGIGRPEFESAVSSYVLSDFSKDEMPGINSLLEHLSNSYIELIEKNFKAIVTK